MRFEEPLDKLVARYPELRLYESKQKAIGTTYEEIAEGVARGRRLHGRFWRRAARAVAVEPILATGRLAKQTVAAAVEKLEKDRAFRSAVRELSRLGHGQLRDIGIPRSEILHVARKLVYAQRRDAPITASRVEPSPIEDAFEHARAA